MLEYHVTSEVWLSLERYHNEGLKPEETKAIIEGIRDPYSSTLNLRTRPMGINNNLIVRTCATSQDAIEWVVEIIEGELSRALIKKGLQKAG